MTEIKICGITDKEDALFAAACGVDALGFIFYAPSPRAITPDKARTIISKLPKSVVNVGVFVNHEYADVKRIFNFCGLDLIQLHGDESAEYCRNFAPSLLIKAVSPPNEEELKKFFIYPVKAILLDARDSGRYGGTGQKANWTFAAAIRDAFPLVLSGGLNGENISEAIAQIAPDAVDINSGIESALGKKDRKKLRDIVEIIRDMNGNTGDRKVFSR